MLLTQPDLQPHAAAAGGEHPFLLVKRTDFPELKALAARSPWREQRENVLHDAQAVQYTPGARIDYRAITLARILSSTALAYILDPDQRPRYVARIVEHLRPFESGVEGSIVDEMRSNAEKNLWRYGVPTGNAFFQAVLALDIIHDDLAPADRTRLEAVLRDGPAHYFSETRLSWRQGSLAAKAIWAVYERDAARYGPIVEEWQRDALGSISADGIFNGGTGYADARWTFADREYKAVFGEVLAHAGILPDWYAQPRLKAFHEWLTGYAYTPFRVLWTFGDGAPGSFNARYQPGPERAYRYSRVAAGYAAWLRDGHDAPSGLASYVLTREPPAEPQPAPSRLFPDGGAWLKETSLDHRALAGALWNVKTHKDAHAHKETNALCLAAYGELVLRNAGYNGWDTPEQGFSWTYIHDRAIAANTALIDYAVPQTAEQERLPPEENDHVRKFGNGVTAGLLTGVIDYALGDSGDALPNGRHLRSFLFMHPADGAAGYFATIDAFVAARPHATAHIAWHPASAQCTVTAAEQTYDWTIRQFGGSDVGLTVFLATPPAKVARCDGILSDWDKGIVGKYLVADYATDGNGRSQAVTVLFPHDAQHPPAAMSRTAGPGFTGAVVRQGAIADTLVESDGTTAVSPDGSFAFRGAAASVRRGENGRLIRAWFKDVDRLTLGDVTLESTSPVTLFIEADTLRILSDGSTQITLRGPKSVRVSPESEQSFEIKSQSDGVSFSPPCGVSRIEWTA